jgi:hypothetical protein
MSLAAVLRLVRRTRWVLVTLAALLLVAQHGALTHALTHADLHGHDEAVHAHAQSAAHDDAEHPGNASTGKVAGFCAFDLVYSQVLGGLHGGHDLTFAAAEHVLVIAAVLAVRSSVTAVPYDSRGPPVLS